jgi:peptidoglycan/xylan/chitin deacetylase (PgdA/CDA1 family)
VNDTLAVDRERLSTPHGARSWRDRCGAHAARTAVMVAACLAIAACHDEHWLTYPWDDRKILCSQAFDDMKEKMRWGKIEREMERAERTSSVLLVHAHVPGKTVSVEAIERILTMADQHHLAFLTFRELEPDATPQPGIAIAFDDSSIDEWFTLRDQLAGHGAHVTFFVAAWQAASEAQRAELRTLADDGDDVQPHSVNHLYPLPYVEQHGVDAYIADEVLPSIQALIDSGYPPGTVYAYPFGSTSDELNDAVLQIVPRVRVSPRSCPH